MNITFSTQTGRSGGRIAYGVPISDAFTHCFSFFAPEGMAGAESVLIPFKHII